MEPEGVRVDCFARYSACDRAGVMGGGGAISAFLSRGGEDDKGCRCSLP